MKYAILSLILCLSLFSCQSGKQGNASAVKDVDICIYGGTSAGVVAAYSAKKMGKSVILIEPGKYLGGMTTGGLGMTDIGNKYAVTGLARLFYRRIGEHYNRFEQWTFPPSVATATMMRFVKDADLDVLYHRRITDASVKNKKIESITLEDSRQPGKKESIQIRAKQFIDCTYEGDLMAKAGVSYFTGREGNDEYDETLNGVQMSVWHQFPDGVDPYLKEGDPDSGLCWGIQPNTLKEQGSGDKLIQAYNFRLCLTDNKENQRPFEKPENYDPAKYELLARAIRKMDLHIDNYLLFNWGAMPDNKYDVNNRGPLSTDMIGMNYDYPDGDYATRERIWQEHVDYTKGLLYFLTHDERVPLELRDQVSRFGWAKDEFVDNDNFPTQLYVREARRLNGEYIMTQKNCQGEETVGDAIGMAAYGMDSHNCQRIVTNGMVKNEGDVEYHGFPPYPISYKSITPKREECTNLLVPVCVSSTHIAFGSIRMEPVFMVLGQSAAVASALAIDDNTDVQTIDVTKLRRILKENPYLDGSTPEILVDDSEIDKVSSAGRWQKSFGLHYKNSYLWSANSKNDCTLSFMPVVKKADAYEVFFYCTALADQEMPDVMAFDIACKEGIKQVEISPRAHKGSWVSLGTYAFEKGHNRSSVMIDGHRSKGPLFADAILLVPKK
ncbi:FAD-dependent oxidoreductase [uncultured Parabacteroides sp.]|uniref:FAD-dependent oxidoreductase n=1 Tax=uncultured Parabacteroides sp. TaxID=512312 RepID=UPI0025D9CEF0|nr:FAD-dependent oxidoreductase [uncultured Parabacteroides sp.]